MELGDKAVGANATPLSSQTSAIGVEPSAPVGAVSLLRRWLDLEAMLVLATLFALLWLYFHNSIKWSCRLPFCSCSCQRSTPPALDRQVSRDLEENASAKPRTSSLSAYFAAIHEQHNRPRPWDMPAEKRGDRRLLALAVLVCMLSAAQSSSLAIRMLASSRSYYYSSPINILFCVLLFERWFVWLGALSGTASVAAREELLHSIARQSSWLAAIPFVGHQLLGFRDWWAFHTGAFGVQLVLLVGIVLLVAVLRRLTTGSAREHAVRASIGVAALIAIPLATRAWRTPPSESFFAVWCASIALLLVRSGTPARALRHLVAHDSWYLHVAMNLLFPLNLVYAAIGGHSLPFIGCVYGA